MPRVESPYLACVSEYAANIRAILGQATDEDLADGCRWYPTAARIVAGIGEWSGLATDRVAAMLAALSPRNPWAWNVQDAAAFAKAIADGGEMPSATTYGHNRRMAWALGSGTADWRTAAPKVRSFVANIMGDTEAVTVDVWAARVCTAGDWNDRMPAGRYRAMAQAFRIVAVEQGLAPRDLQAITWVTAERIGLGSKRRGRGHTSVMKRGTFPIVQQLLEAA
jgi:hypothetical protein